MRTWLDVGNGEGRAWENASMLDLGSGGDMGPSWIRERWGRRGCLGGGVAGNVQVPGTAGDSRLGGAG